MTPHVGSEIEDGREYARALIIGHAATTAANFEVSASSSSSQDLGGSAGFSEVMRDCANLLPFLEGRGCIIDGLVCDTDLTSLACTERIERFLDSKHAGLRILSFLGDGSSSNGAWCLKDGKIALETIFEIWNRIHRSPNDNLLIYSDSCYSGHLCEEASRLQAHFYVQASCLADEQSLETVFTTMWIRAHQDPANRRTIVERFEQQNQQQVAFFTPQQARNNPIWRCGDLVVYLLGRHVSGSASGTDGTDGGGGGGGGGGGTEQPAEESGLSDSQAKGQDVFEKLQFDVQRVLTELFEIKGWRLEDPKVIEILEAIHDKCQPEPRRGGSDEPADLDDVIELLKEFIGETGLQPAQALEKFNDEFD